jgi:signal transduction histidine kinase
MALSRPLKGSIANNLALRLGWFGAVIFGVTLIGTVLLDALENPSQLRNAVVTSVLQGAVRPVPGGGFSLDEMAALLELKASSPGFWFVVSDGKILIEHNPSARPVLPVDIRIDGPSLSASFTTGDRSTAIRTIEVPGMEDRIVLATTGAEPSFLHIALYYLRVSGLKILLGAGALALLISATIALAIRQITRIIRGMAEAAADITPDDPKGELSSDRVPIELHPLTQALDGALDRIAASMDQQRRFISNAAHELRTPLAVLRVKIEGIKDHALRQILASDLQRLSSLVTAMLDLARMRARATGLPMEKVDLTVLAREVLGDHASTIIDRTIEAEFVEPESPVVVTGNATVLRSAISNLIANAASHSQTATRLMVRVTDGPRIEIVDNGIGIAAEQRETVIEPFARLSPAAPGTGLGLAIVREIMAAHGGSLSIGETPGGGLTVSLNFSTAQPEPEM